MEIKVRLFALLKEKAGCEEIRVRWFEGFRGRDVFSYLAENYEGLVSLLPQSLLAINGSFAYPDAVLQPGDELAILPPVSGG